MQNKTDHVIKQRHIVMYLGSLTKGGAQRVMVNLARYFRERGWKVTFVTTYFSAPEFYFPEAAWNEETGEIFSEEEIAHRGIDNPIRRIYSDPGESALSGGRIRNFLTRCKTLRDIWKKLSPDLILSFIGSNNVMALLTAKGLNIPVVVSVRADPAQEYMEKKTRIPAMLLFPKAAGVVLQTNDAAAYFPEKIRKKVKILPNAVHEDFLRQRWEGERTKEIVCVGRLDDNKAQDIAIRAFAKAKHEGWKLVLLGDGPSKDSFKTLAKELQVEDEVIFAGSSEHIADRIEKSAIFVLPSKTEGMPNALIEAMSLGIACVSTDCPCGGPKDLIRDGENGYLVPVDDVEQMAEKFSLLIGDETLRERIGKKAAEIQEDLSPDRIGGLWENYLCSLIRSTL